MSRPRPSLRTLAAATVQATLLALVLASLMWLMRIRPFSVVLGICLVFSLVMWLGFHLLQPWLDVPLEDGRSPMRVAVDSTFRMGTAYTVLLVVVVALVRACFGLNLFSQAPVAIITYLLGFTVTVSINGFHLTESLVEAERTRAQVAREHQRQALELEAARALQVGLLPREAPAPDRLDMAWQMHTAEAVGGDFFDVLEDAEGVLHGAFGDATGHGMRAGMVAVAVKSHFRTGTGDPDQDLLAIGRGVRALGLPNTGIALTLWRLEGLSLHLAHAGMPPPLLWRAATGLVEVLPLKAPPLGQLNRPLTASLTVDLAPGDLVVFTSDGLPECFSPGGTQLGYGTVPLLVREAAAQGPQAVVDHLSTVAFRHADGHPLDDDLSLFAFRIREGGTANDANGTNKNR